jgi:phosphoenolpyruvate synthase/pyruvate phosphate dikinase
MAQNIQFKLIVKRKISPFFDYILALGTGTKKNYKKTFGYEHAYDYYCYLNGEVYYDKKSLLAEKQKILKQKTKDPSLLLKRVKQCEKQGEELLQFSRQIQRSDLSPLSNNQLKDLLKQWANKIYLFLPFLMMPISIENYLEKRLDSFLRKKFKEKGKLIKKYKFILSIPSKTNLQLLEQFSILKLAKLYKKEKRITKKLEKLIKNHVEKFGCLGFRYGYGKIWDKRDVIKRIKWLSRQNPEKRYRDLKKAKEKEKEEFQKAIKILNPDKTTLLNIKALTEYIYLRTFRTNVLNIAYAQIKNLITEIGKRIGLSFEDVNHMILPEVLLFKKINPKVINARKKGFALLKIKDKVKIYTGKNIEKLRKIYKLGIPEEKISILKGVSANKGIAKGKAKVLKKPEDVIKIKKGDILVTSMTTPEFVPAMEKASAFVTDEGGVTCHAAIVAREMKKPCIIGTKIATKVLKDGDLVEVDANKGVIRIMKTK